MARVKEIPESFAVQAMPAKTAPAVWKGVLRLCPYRLPSAGAVFFPAYRERRSSPDCTGFGRKRPSGVTLALLAVSGLGFVLVVLKRVCPLK